MKYTKFLLPSFVCMAAAVSLSSCDNDDLHIGGLDGDGLLGSDGNVVYVTDALGSSETPTFSINGSGSFNIFAQTTKGINGNCSVTFNYDADVLTAYNEANKTDYPARPPEMLALSNNGVVSFSNGALKSDALTVTVSGNGQLDPEKEYALPLSYTVANGTAVGGATTMVVLVRDFSTFPGADKTYNGNPGMKMIGVFEVNDENPLNAIGFTLKNSGKQLFDMVVLFSANINVNPATGAAYIKCNDNVQALLDNADKYIRPLQERGIKVILGILGNWDRAGVSTLDKNSCQAFAQEVKIMCDNYNLDGVFLDDEYTDYDAAASGKYPGFVPQSSEACSRMAYEIKKVQPERLVVSYRYEALFNGVEIDGQQPGEFFDYVVNDYWVTSNPTSTYPGLRQDQAGTGSWNCSDWSQCIPSNDSWTERFSLTGMREEGYGALMIFNFKCSPDYWLTDWIVNDLGQVATDFYNDELQYDGVYYKKDWN